MAHSQSSDVRQRVTYGPFTNWLQHYEPWTNWQGLFQGWFSPNITFGSNIQDKPVEEHVLDKVGSYGMQLNRILDAMSVLVARADRQDLTPQEESAILQFEELARAADEAAADFQGKPRSEEVTEAAVAHWLDAVADLRTSKPAAYERLSKTIRNYNLPPVDGKCAVDDRAALPRDAGPRRSGALR